MPRVGKRLPPVKEGFHATVYPIKGDRILPSSEHGNVVFRDMSSPHDSYFTPIPDRDWTGVFPPEHDLDELEQQLGHRDTARAFARTPITRAAAENAAWEWGNMVVGAGYGAHPGRARVHVTEPEAEQYADKNGMFMGARVTPSQRIKDTLWGPPAPTGGWVEQTLPYINWKQYRSDYSVHAPNWVTHTLSDEYHTTRDDDGRGDIVRREDAHEDPNDPFTWGQPPKPALPVRREIPGQTKLEGFKGST